MIWTCISSWSGATKKSCGFLWTLCLINYQTIYIQGQLKSGNIAFKPDNLCIYQWKVFVFGCSWEMVKICWCVITNYGSRNIFLHISTSISIRVFEKYGLVSICHIGWNQNLSTGNNVLEVLTCTYKHGTEVRGEGHKRDSFS